MSRDENDAVSFHLPSWLADYATSYRTDWSDDERMLFVIEASRRNVVQGTGGPFAAGVFEIGSRRLISLGVNLVTTEKLSILHAEMVAFILAQRTLQTYDLGGAGMASHELFTSSEPCAMCFGAIPWSGVRCVVCAARASDAMAIGFDEGPKMVEWCEELKRRGIDTVRDVQRDAAREVFSDYARLGGRIYNSREAT
jgi:tRNA(Arg) A34 adenosine deaminase TadA